MMEEKKLTGYPSIDKPWLKYYSEEAINTPLPECTVFENIYEHNYQFPNDTALEYYGRKISYQMLFDNAEATKNALLAYGVSKGSKVILYTSATPETVYTVLALCRIGAVANMINPLFTNEQVIDRINETDATLMIALDQLYSRIAESIKKTCIQKTVIVPVTNAMPMLYGAVAKLKLKTNYPEECTILWNDFIKSGTNVYKTADTPYEHGRALIMVYSSGTTGASKGIVLTNDGINATISHYIISDFPYKRGNRFLQMIPVWFSTGMVFSLLMPLCLGITTVLEPVFSKESFVADMKKYKPNMTLTATSLWLYAMKCKELRKVDFSFLTYPITGGEQVLPRVELALNNFLHEHGCNASLLKGYGMCELGSTVSADSLLCVKPGATGYPISHVTVTAFDPDTNQEMKYNERGEIRVQSPCSMKEYFKNPDATNRYFWKDDDGCVWGCTGDMGYIDEDGFVYILGRISDFFVTSSGKNFYCFDVEAAIMENPNIAQCEVVGLKTKKGYEIPVAHLIIEGECTLCKLELIRQVHDNCVNSLPPDAVPQGYKICHTFPVKNNGKRDVELIKADRDGFVTIRKGQLEDICFG